MVPCQHVDPTWRCLVPAIEDRLIYLSTTSLCKDSHKSCNLKTCNSQTI